MAIEAQVRPTITSQGGSSRKYMFTVYPLGANFRALGAVYIFFNGNTGLYVGQTSDLSTRFADHHKESCCSRRGANRMGILLVPSESDRLAIEADLLAGPYDWPCNG